MRPNAQFFKLPEKFLLSGREVAWKLSIQLSLCDNKLDLVDIREDRVAIWDCLCHMHCTKEKHGIPESSRESPGHV